MENRFRWGMVVLNLRASLQWKVVLASGVTGMWGLENPEAGVFETPQELEERAWTRGRFQVETAYSGEKPLDEIEVDVAPDGERLSFRALSGTKA